MSVQRITLEIPPAGMPHDIEILLEETAGPLVDWQAEHEGNQFVPADYVLLFDAFTALRPQMTARPPTFLEWGSGCGVATLLAASLGWNARGIEIQPQLVQISRQFTAAFDLPAHFLEGSFFPGEPRSVEKLPSLCAQTDVVYVYPWPDQEVEIFDLFDRMTRPGTWLVAYYGVEDVRIFRKQGAEPHSMEGTNE